MSRLLHWYVADQLHSRGWPKRKGFLREPYAPAELVDQTLEQGLQLCMGLGAGRPELGARLIADAFPDNPWTGPSSDKLQDDLSRVGLRAIARHREISPWSALYADSRLSQWLTEIDWRLLEHETTRNLWANLSAQAAYWGIAHEDEFRRAFEVAQRSLPSVDEFYSVCEEVIGLFHEARPALSPIPRSLSEKGIIARRLKNK